MKDIVMDRLSRMEDLEQRKLLKQLMTSVFLNLVEHQEDMYRKLEKRVIEELDEYEDNYDIYVTLCSRDSFDPIHDYLYPMIPEDVNPPIYDLTSLLTSLSNEQHTKLFTVFMQCDYIQLKELLNSGRTFRGELVTTAGRCAIEAVVKPNHTYIHELEKLYETFQKNGISWKTANHPYAHKFVDIVLVRCDRKLEADEEIVEAMVNLEEYERYKKLDAVPLWNIEKLKLKSSGFPVPAADRINYEHVLSLHKTGAEHGYLVEESGEATIRYIKRSADELTVVTPQEKSGIWNVLKLTQPVQPRIGKLEYALVSNRRHNHFMNKYARNQVLTVRAKGEVIRIVHSFEASEILELLDLEVRDQPKSISQTYAMNPFISDNIRSQTDMKTLRLRFRRREDQPLDDFILNDLMSFLVSEVQIYFPEYICEGEWA
ncbi:normocyte-binding protein [Cohnella terricola]|uniref:Normocyte-binding protein n=1 Tax=Cohnella terricola TaxID=1289167 RepID=A0A559J5D7_9BACL|nr:normocyte-binding protein [Cohnella terricola]TVX95089.1 normocyte-binding protein [Cohnella terricola]